MAPICILKPNGKKKNPLAQQALVIYSPHGAESTPLSCRENRSTVIGTGTYRQVTEQSIGTHQTQRREWRKGIQEGRQGKRLGLSRESEMGCVSQLLISVWYREVETISPVWAMALR